jgi:hypothetical protein
VRRVSELMKWVRSGEYDRVLAGEYRKRNDPNQPRVEAGDAAEFYSERFRNLFKEVGEGVTRAGDKVSDAADKLTDWLRRPNPGTGTN